MKRFLWLGGMAAQMLVASAADPVSVFPGTVVRTNDSPTPTTVLAPAVGHPQISSPPSMPSSLSQPVSRVLAGSPIPTSATGTVSHQLAVVYPTSGMIAPTVPVGNCTDGSCAGTTCPSDCGVPLFPTASSGIGRRARPALDRLVAWLSYQPGPSQLPMLTPVPYSSPIRAYFPCRSSSAGNCGSGSCAGGAVGTGPGGGLGVRFGGPADAAGSCAADGSCRDKVCNAPLPKGFGAFARPSGYCPTTGSLGIGCAPIAVPLPASCVGTMGCFGGCGSHRGNAFERLLGFFGPGRHGLTENGCRSCAAGAGDPNWQPPTATVPMIMGYTFPTQGQYRFAHPTTHPSLLPYQQHQAMPFAPAVQSNTQPTGTVVPVGYPQAQRAANQPFTRQ